VKTDLFNLRIYKFSGIHFIGAKFSASFLSYMPSLIFLSEINHFVLQASKYNLEGCVVLKQNDIVKRNFGSLFACWKFVLTNFQQTTSCKQ